MNAQMSCDTCKYFKTENTTGCYLEDNVCRKKLRKNERCKECIDLNIVRKYCENIKMIQSNFGVDFKFLIPDGFVGCNFWE